VLGLLVFPAAGQPMPWLHPTDPRDAILMPQNVSAAAIPHAAGMLLWQQLAAGEALQLQFMYKEVSGACRTGNACHCC
jgi:hypothetical protein